MATEENMGLRNRYELLKGAEHHKNALIEELLRRLDELTEDYHQEKLDHARESHFNREVQLQEIQLLEELRKYKALMVRANTPDASSMRRTLKRLATLTTDRLEMLLSWC